MSALSSILGLKGYAITGAACLAVGGLSGAWTANRLADHGKLKQVVHAQKTERKDQAVADKIGVKAEAAQVQIRTVTKTLIQKVPVYVTPEIDRRYAVPVGFVSLWNDAIAGRVSAPSDALARAYDAPSDVAFSQLGSTAVETIGSCTAIRQQLIDLQDFERAAAKP